MAGYKYPDLVPDMELAAAIDADPVVPSDTVDLNYCSRFVYVGGAGNLKVNLARGSAPVTFTGVPAGTLLPISVSRIYATGTTATNILVCY